MSLFIFDRPVPPELFIDRKDVIERFRGFFRLFSRGVPFSIAIISPFKHGKTSLIYKLIDVLEREFPGITYVLLSLKDVRDFPLALILGFLSRTSGIEEDDVLEARFEDAMLEKLRLMATDLRSGGEKYPRDEFTIKQIFRIINRYVEASGMRLVLFIDEFHLLDDAMKKYEIDKPYDFIRGVLEKTMISIIVSGSMVKQMHEAIEPWGGRFIKFYLSSLDMEDTIGVLVDRFSRIGLNIDLGFARKIYSSVGGHPYYLNIVCSELIGLGRVDDEALYHALTELSPILTDRFSTYVELIEQEVGRGGIDVIKRVVIRHEYGEKLTMDEFKILEKLVRCGILGRRNEEYFVLDKLFERYLMGLEVTSELILPLVNARDIGEELVALDLLSHGHIPYMAYQSRGAFDIIVRLDKEEIGIQVKRRRESTLYLSQEEVDKMRKIAKKLGIKPIIAFVRHIDEMKFDIKYFPLLGTKYEWNHGHQTLREAIIAKSLR